MAACIKMNDINKPIWQWIATILERLDVKGMSSELSEITSDGQIFTVHLLEWRNKDIKKMLNHIDRQFQQNSAAGNQGVPCCSSTIPSSRKAMQRLPEIMYDRDWLAGNCTLSFAVNKWDFEWLQDLLDTINPDSSLK